MEFAETTTVDKYSREVQIVINLLEPDPEYQPFFISDEANFASISPLDEDEISRRLSQYFGDLGTFTFLERIVDFVLRMKASHPEWPDNWSGIIDDE